MFKHVIAVAAAVLAVAGSARAQESGLYISGAAGLDRRGSFKISEAQYMSSLMGSQQLSAGRAGASAAFGVTGLAALGYDFGGPRVELEGNYRSIQARGIREFGRALSNVSGGTRTYGALVNAYYDFDLGRYGMLGSSRVRPYLGAGFGIGFNQFDKLRGTLAANSTTTQLDGGGTMAPAYNLIAGASIGLDSLAPGLSATLEYRYYTVINREVGTTIGNPGTSPLGTNASLHRPTMPNCCHDNSVMLGLRYTFGRTAQPLAPPEPAAPPPRPAATPPVRTYLVMFALNRATLDGAAQDVVHAAAAAARAGQAVRLALTGRADNTGPAALNRRLSQQRAETVAAALVRDGIRRNRMTIAAVGDTDPMVQAPPGVPEARNRSVEIVLR